MSINYLRDQGGSTVIIGGGTQLPDQALNGGKYLTTDGSAPSWVAITKINNLAGGGAKQIAFQSAADTTAFSGNFTIDAASGTLSVYNGGSGTTATLILGSSTYGEHRITTGIDGVHNNQNLRIQPHRQDLIGSGQRGGTVTICGGDVGGGSGLYGLAGGVNIVGGGASSTADGSGLYGANGPVTITGGPGSGTYPVGGSVTVSGGTGNNSAGSVLINGGTGTNGGGTVSISTAPTSSLVQRLKILANGAWSIGSNDTSYGTTGQVLTSNGNAAPTWQAITGNIPTQTGNGGKYLTTDGTTASWSTVTSVGTLSGLSLSGNLVATTSLSFKGADSSGSALTIIGGSGSTAYSGAPGGGVTISGGMGNIFYDGIGGGNVTITGGGNNGGTGGSTGGSVFINGGVAPVGGAIVLSTAPSVALIERFRILANGAWSIGTGGTSYGTSGQVLTSNGNAAPTWQTVTGNIPAQTGNGGKYLTTDGTNTSWATISSTFTGGAISSGTINGTDSTSGSSLTVRGGNGSAGSGGDLNLYSGTGTATPGNVLIKTAGGAGLPLATRMTFSGSTGEIQFNSAYNESISAVSAGTSTSINCALGNNFDISMSTSISSLSFTNIPSERRMYFCTLIFIQDAVGGKTVAWPASIRWQGGGVPVLTPTANKIDMITLVTYDGGASWLGVIAGQNF